MLDKLKELFEVGKRGVRHFFDKDVPISYKIIPIAALIYLIYPFDLLSDLIPFLGQADDLTIISLATAFFVDLADKKVPAKKITEKDEAEG